MRIVVFAAAMALIAAACQSSETASDISTTSSVSVTSVTYIDTTVTTAEPPTTTTTEPPTTTTTEPPTTTTTTSTLPPPSDEEIARVTGLLAEQGDDIVLSYLYQIAAQGSDWEPLPGIAPYSGAALELARLWDSWLGAAWEPCVAEGTCQDLSTFSIPTVYTQEAVYEIAADATQIFPLGDDRWLAWGVYSPSGFLLSASNALTDFVFRVDGDIVTLDDMVVWTRGTPTSRARGFWLSDLIYGQEIGSVEPAAGLDIEVVRGFVAGPTGTEDALALYLQMTATASSAYQFDGMRNQIFTGEWADAMTKRRDTTLAEFPEGTWSMIRPVAVDAGTTFDFAFRQLEWPMRALDSEHTLTVDGFGTLTLGGVDRPATCSQRSFDEIPIVADGTLRCLSWYGYEG